MEQARAAGFSHSPPSGRFYRREWDTLTRSFYEVGVFSWARGDISCDSRTLAVTVNPRP